MHAEAHVGVAGLNAELVEQSAEVRVVGLVENDEAGIDRQLSGFFVHPNRIRVAADVPSGLEYGDVISAAENPGRRHACDTGSHNSYLHDEVSVTQRARARTCAGTGRSLRTRPTA